MQKVAIIILNFNKRHDILACLKSVYQLDYPSYEVIVVDNASTDGSQDAVRDLFPDAHLICNETNLGAPGGRNVGIDYAEKHFDFDAVLFLDNDAIVEPAFLKHLTSAVEAKKDVGIAGGKAFMEYPSTTIMSTGIDVNFYTGFIGDIGSGKQDQGQFDEERVVPAYGGFGLLVEKEVLQELKGFDDHFNPYGWGEVDLCLRAKDLGYKTLYVPSAIIYHKGCKVGRGPIPHYEKHKTKNYLFLMRRHAKGFQKVTVFISLFVRGFFRFIVLVIRGQFSVIGAQLRGFLEGIVRK